MTISVQCINLSYTIKSKEILNDISFSTNCGEHVVIIGPNGAGKSTLLRLLAQELKPTSGQVQIDGKSLNQYNNLELAQLRSVLKSTDTIPYGFSVKEIVEFGRTPWRKSSSFDEDNKIVHEAMTKTDVLHLADRKFYSLSDGEKARCTFARLLAQSAPIILLDEPSAHLDIGQQEQLLKLIKTTTNDGNCVISIIHDLTCAYNYADKILILKDGRLQAYGTPQEVMTDDNLSNAYDYPITISSTNEKMIVCAN